MKKLFFTFVLLAAVATSFMSCEITANGDLVGILSSTSFDNGIPEGTYSSNDNSIIYMPGMSLQAIKFASSGEATVARNGNIYTVNMTGLTFNE
jgi:hypothetical protein